MISNLTMLKIRVPNKYLIYFLFFITFSSCVTTEVKGIKIGHTLYEQQDFITNKKFCMLINQTLNQNSSALIALLNFPCGGAAGCYDLGSVISQIAYKIGEQDFFKMINIFSKKQKTEIRSFIEVGLKYGFRLNNNRPNKTLDEEFPLLSKALPN